jgi:hypothetical protein
MKFEWSKPAPLTHARACPADVHYAALQRPRNPAFGAATALHQCKPSKGITLYAYKEYEEGEGGYVAKVRVVRRDGTSQINWKIKYDLASLDVAKEKAEEFYFDMLHYMSSMLEDAVQRLNHEKD